MSCEHSRIVFSTVSVRDMEKKYEPGFYWCLDCDFITRKLERRFKKQLIASDLKRLIKWTEKKIEQAKADAEESNLADNS